MPLTDPAYIETKGAPQALIDENRICIQSRVILSVDLSEYWSSGRFSAQTQDSRIENIVWVQGFL